MKTATTTTAKKSGKDLKEAEILMTRYARLNQNRTDLLDSIMDELKGYETELKETENKLIAIGERNKDAFDEKNNLQLSDGYLHISKTTLVVTKKKFDLAKFCEEHPDMVDITLKVKPIKEAFLDEKRRKELTAQGVTLDSKDGIAVKLNKL